MSRVVALLTALFTVLTAAGAGTVDKRIHTVYVIYTLVFLVSPQPAVPRACIG